MCYSPRLQKNLNDLMQKFEDQLDSLNLLKPEQDEEDYQTVFVLTKSTSADFKKNVRVAEKRIREAKVSVKKPAVS